MIRSHLPQLTRRQALSGLAAGALGAYLSSSLAREVPKDEILELRQYTLRKGQRDTLIALFENHFLDPQNAVGAHILGTFRDVDDPDRFVWLRGFPDMGVRKSALESFYGGPAWLAHRQQANATMVDSDNVLLLRRASAGSGFPEQSTGRRRPGSHLGVRIHYLGGTDPNLFANFYARTVLPRLIEAGALPIAEYITCTEANNFRLPIREHESVYIWFARWNSLTEEENFTQRFSKLSGLRDDIPAALLPALMRKPERLRLAPTARSELP